MKNWIFFAIFLGPVCSLIADPTYNFNFFNESTGQKKETPAPVAPTTTPIETTLGETTKAPEPEVAKKETTTEVKQVSTKEKTWGPQIGYSMNFFKTHKGGSNKFILQFQGTEFGLKLPFTKNFSIIPAAMFGRLEMNGEQYGTKLYVEDQDRWTRRTGGKARGARVDIRNDFEISDHFFIGAGIAPYVVDAKVVERYWDRDKTRPLKIRGADLFVGPNFQYGLLNLSVDLRGGYSNVKYNSEFKTKNFSYGGNIDLGLRI